MARRRAPSRPSAEDELPEGLRKLFVLTTRTALWFIEHGFTQASVDDLPTERKALYNFQRNSQVFSKSL